MRINSILKVDISQFKWNLNVQDLVWFHEERM